MATTVTSSPSMEERERAEGLYFVVHPSFFERGANGMYGPDASVTPYTGSYMPDEVTRQCCQRMHYAAWRLSKEKAPAKRAVWKQHYLSMRDLVVLGNRKLVFRAVRGWLSHGTDSDDLTGECQIVMIRSVAAFNPWLGIRFSTYAYTCLMRALSRMSQKTKSDRMSKAVALDQFMEVGEAPSTASDPGLRHQACVEDFFREGCDLLTAREKEVLVNRFLSKDTTGRSTLEQVGKRLGLSKERVRQVETTALLKLRAALA